MIIKIDARIKDIKYFYFLKNNTNMMDWTKRMFAIIKKKTTIIFFENKQSFNGILKNNNSNVFLIPKLDKVLM